MRILFSTDQVYMHGGIEKVLAEKANYFAEHFGYDVYIITTEQRQKAPCYPLSPKITLVDLGINYQRDISYFSLVNLKKIWPHYKQLNQAISTIKPDVIISCSFAFDFYWLPFIHTKISKFKEFHSSRFYTDKQRKNASFASKLRFRLNDFIESKFDKLILLNPDERPFYYSDNLHVIPNPIAIPFSNAGLTSKKAVAAGRIAPVKGFDNLIKSWKIVVNQHPDWKLDIYGEDYLGTKAKLEALITELGLENNVNFPGTSNNMVATMAGYSFYAMSSVTECFPMVLLESLSIGLPIVSFDCPTGPRHIVTDGDDGLLAANQNIKSLAEKMLLLCADTNLRHAMGVKAKQNAMRFTNELIMEQWKRLFMAMK